MFYILEYIKTKGMFYMKKVSKKIISFVTIICLFATIVIPTINTYAVEGVAREP